MANFLDDLASLSGNSTLQNISGSGIGQILGNAATSSLTNSINNKLNPTPKPAAQAAPAVISTPTVSVSDTGIMKKVMIAAASVMGLLVVVYLVKKKGRR